MVQNILNAVYREVRGLHQAAYILALFTFGSQLLALIRDRLLAHTFGAGIELDLYYAAFRIPDLLYVLFASTLSVYVLIPFIAERIEEGRRIEAQNFLSQFFSIFVVIYGVIALFAILFAPQIVVYAFPGFVESAGTLVLLMRILLLQPLILGISSLYGVVTQMEHRFILYAISPILYNLGIIAGLLLLYPHMGIAGLAVGVVLGALGHLCIQIPTLLRSNLMPKLTSNFEKAGIIAVCKTSMTRVLTLSLHQIVLLSLVGFASLMAVGSVSVLQFAYNLQSVPLAIIGVSYSVAAFPLLAQLFAEKKIDLFSRNIRIAIRHIIFWSLPALALFIVIRAQFVRVVLGSGAFDWDDTRLTAAILALFILSLTAQALHLLLVRALYAVGNTRLPLLVTVFSSLVTLMTSYGFYLLMVNSETVYVFVAHVMRLEGVSGIEVLALPFGYSLSLILHSIVLLACSAKHLYIRFFEFTKPLFQAGLASFFGGYVAYTTLNYFVTGFVIDTLISIFVQGLLAAIGGLAGYVLIQRLFRNEELAEVYEALKRRLNRNDIVVPQNEDTLAI